VPVGRADWTEGCHEVRAAGLRRKEAGAALGAEQLEPADTATTVQLRGGERLLTDGPFIETKEHLLGFYLIDVADLDAALDWAAKKADPVLRHGRGAAGRRRRIAVAQAPGLTAAALERAYQEEWTAVVDPVPPPRRPAGCRGRHLRGRARAAHPAGRARPGCLGP
jgi:hypothetical protein